MEPIDYPVSVSVIGISLIIIIYLGLMTFLYKRAPNIVTPSLVISMFITLTFVLVAIFSTLRPTPESKTGDLLLGALISTFTTMIAYWFGKKNE